MRKGILLCVDFEGIGLGYADFHPWAHRGDKVLEQQYRQALYFARIDAEARANKKSLVLGIRNIKQHNLILDYDNVPDSGLVKLKVCPYQMESLLVILSQRKHVRFRLDFNASFSESQIVLALKKLMIYRAQIEFIEDPCPYNSDLWMRLEDAFGIPFAFDDVSDKINKKDAIVIIKPAVEDYRLYLEHKKIVVTSYLGHPLEQMAALYAASQFSEEALLPCGIASHVVYQENVFSKEFTIKNNVLKCVHGTGFGFDHLWSQIKWKKFLSIGDQIKAIFS